MALKVDPPKRSAIDRGQRVCPQKARRRRAAREGCAPAPGSCVDRRSGRAGPAQNSGGSCFIWAAVKTGPSLQTYTGPMLQRPHLPSPHFMRFSSVV